MKSIRQSTFETNSSSAHSLTLCTKSLREKLQRRELFYVGHFKVDSDSDETSINKVEEKDCITFEEAINKVKEYLKKNPDFSDNLTVDMLTPEFVNEHYWDSNYDIFELFDCALNYNFRTPEYLFAAKNSDNYLVGDKIEYELKDGDTLEIYNMSVSC